MIDIGGRSTEMILGRGRTPHVAESFQVGSVSLSMRYFADGRFTAAAFRAAQVAAGAELEEALAPFAPRALARGARLVGHRRRGVAGAGGQRRHRRPHHARRPALVHRALPRRPAASTALAAARPEGRPPRRCIAGGLAILYTLATQFGIDELQPAKRRAAPGRDRRPARAPAAPSARAGGHDMRDASVRELQRRFGVDTRAGRARAQRGAGAARRRRARAPTPRRGASSAGPARCTRSA